MSQLEPIGSSHHSITVSERVEILNVTARNYLDQYLTDNTRVAYSGDVNTWRRYCSDIGIPPTAIDIGTIVGFVRWMSMNDYAVKTMRRRMTGLRSASKIAGHPIPDIVSEAATQAITIEERKLAQANELRGRGKAPAITIPQLRAMSSTCPDTAPGRRDRALLLLGFAIAGRRSEIASLHVSDITETVEGLLVRIRFGKTGGREVAVPYGTYLPTCPIRSWRAWLAELQAVGLGEGPALRRIDRHGNILGGLTPQGVGIIVTGAAERAGLAGRTAHGLRSGLATEARRAGRDAVVIAAQGGWTPNSRELFGYMQIIDRWTDNAVANIGL